jgi:hypothetical protein
MNMKCVNKNANKYLLIKHEKKTTKGINQGCGTR